MKRIISLLFAAVLLLGSASADGWNDLVRNKAAEIAEKKFTSDYGVADYFADCLESYGPFRDWSIEQKNWVSQLMPYLLTAEEARVKTYHLDGAVEPFDGPILQWQYGVMQPDLLSREEALRKAQNFLRAAYTLDVSEAQVSADLYTGHRSVGAFPKTYWVFRFGPDAEICAEVWVNARTGSMPIHQALDAVRIAMQAYAGVPGEGKTADAFAGKMIASNRVSVVFEENAGQWHVIIQSQGVDVQIVIQDKTLEIVSTKTATE